jgi:hypothetical protein
VEKYLQFYSLRVKRPIAFTFLSSTASRVLPSLRFSRKAKPFLKLFCSYTPTEVKNTSTAPNAIRSYSLITLNCARREIIFLPAQSAPFIASPNFAAWNYPRNFSAVFSPVFLSFNLKTNVAANTWNRPNISP